METLTNECASRRDLLTESWHCVMEIGLLNDQLSREHDDREILAIRRAMASAETRLMTVERMLRGGQ